MSQGLPQDITDDETLARFVVVKEWVRADKTIRPDAFVPPKDLNLSVTRHIGLTEMELWRFEFDVAEQLTAAFYTVVQMSKLGRQGSKI